MFPLVPRGVGSIEYGKRYGNRETQTRYKLKASQIGKAKKPGMQNDGGGLYLSTSKTLSQSWIYRYRKNNRLRDIGLGSAMDVTLSKARELADIAREAVREGREPRAAVKGRDGPITFRDAATQYIDSHAPSWRNAKHRNQWTNTLTSYAYPVIGDLTVDAIETDHVLRILEAIWYDKTETASRVRMRIESVLSWAKARGYRDGFNPAIWRGHLDQLLPSPKKIAKVEHFPAIPYADLPKFYQSLKESGSITTKALRFTILTACRTNEAIGATWNELDGDLWLIPGERMKAGREHRVPLSKECMALLGDLEKQAMWVFPGLKEGKPLSNMAMLRYMRMKGTQATVHGMRSSFTDWAAEKTSHEKDVVEMALAHTITNQTEAAYRRGELLEKRRTLMQDWANYLERTK